MGGEWFTVVGDGATPEEAFERLKEQALWDHGHAGYTGTIAEKSEFLLVPYLHPNCPAIPTERVAMFYTEEVAAAQSSPWTKKWGPAGCIEIEPITDERRFLFFGVASV
jgi:hypothetical protein